ncbi:MAG: RNA polymerase sigma factor, partial [Solirubrobacteraceae bacterium]
RKEGLFTDGPLKEHYADNSDLVEQVDDRRKVARLVGRMVGRLNEKERNAVALCVLHGYTRPEAAKLLGESEPAFQKIMDRASRKIAGFVVGIDARGCGDDEWARLLAERWPDQKRRLALCPGKEVCAKLNQRLQGKRKQAVSSTKLARDLRASEIEPEARDLLLRLDRLGQ